jgi:hypothetical protein
MWVTGPGTLRFTEKLSRNVIPFINIGCSKRQYND